MTILYSPTGFSVSQNNRMTCHSTGEIQYTDNLELKFFGIIFVASCGIRHCVAKGFVALLQETLFLKYI